MKFNTILKVTFAALITMTISSQLKADWDLDSDENEGFQTLRVYLDVDDDIDETHVLIDEVLGEVILQITEYRNGIIVDLETREYDLGSFHQFAVYGGTNSVNVMRNPTFQLDQISPIGEVLFYGGALDDDLQSADLIVGYEGNDLLKNATLIHGGEGDDEIWNTNEAFGFAGNDTINNAWVAWGGEGDDVITYGIHPGFTRPDVANIFGGPGDDYIRFNVPCNYSIRGDEGNDHIVGSDYNNVIHGGAGDDFIIGGAGNDNLFGDQGDDTLHGMAGNDILFGSSGFDNLWGWEGDDHIIPGDYVEIEGYGFGNSGADRIYVKWDDFQIAYFADDFNPREGDRIIYQYSPAPVAFGVGAWQFNQAELMPNN
ncbi:MAG: hypothetical protein HKN47_10310 [Pirellulaceae bacterium]|nr:hypothetical protein [Pirellulaceae bacterium]